MNDKILQEVEANLPVRFFLLPQLSQNQNVYGRILYEGHQRVSQRVYAPIYEQQGTWQWKTFPGGNKIEPFRVYFVQKVLVDQELCIVPVGLERVVFWKPELRWVRPLWLILHHYHAQLSEKLETCDRCTKGIYRNGNICFRCGGKGYFSPADLRRNQTYDHFSANRKS